MAILKVARMGHPVLNRTADAVEDPTAPEIQRLIADMVDTMADAPGIGLAAPQVGQGRVFAAERDVVAVGLALSVANEDDA